MNKLSTITLITLSLIVVLAYNLQAQGQKNMEIVRNGSRPSQKGPETGSPGEYRIDPLFTPHEGVTRAHASTVTFEPGARTAWHTHPLGRIADCHIRRRVGPGSRAGQFRRFDLEMSLLDPSPDKALARRFCKGRRDPYCDSRGA